MCASAWECISCRVLGTPIETIIATEDREIFSQKLQEINETLALSYSATDIEEAVRVAHKIGYAASATDPLPLNAVVNPGGGRHLLYSL